MCLVLLALNVHPQYPVVVASNRDERIDRPTSILFDHGDGIYGGQDLEAGGMWGGVNRVSSCWGFLTNFKSDGFQIDAPSRGMLIHEYLKGCFSPQEYLQSLKTRTEYWNPFNLLIGKDDDVWYYCSEGQICYKLDPGYYGLSNGVLNNNWFRVERGKRLLQDSINLSGRQLTDFLWKILLDNTTRSRDPDDERPLSDISVTELISGAGVFVPLSRSWGTVSSTILLLGGGFFPSLICERQYTHDSEIDVSLSSEFVFGQ